MTARRLASVCALAATIVVLPGCSTGVQEADRAIFVNACAGGTGATQADCACAYDDLSGGGGGGSSDRLIQDTIDDLQRGQVPRRLTRAIARCSTPR